MNKKFNKKTASIIIIVLFVVGILLPFLYTPIKYANFYDFTVEKYDMVVNVNESGDLHIIESITNKYHNDNTVFYKNIVYSKNNTFSSAADKSSLVHDVSLRVESDGEVVFDSETSLNTSRHFVGYSYDNDRDERGERIKCSDDVEDCEMIFYYNEEGIAKETTFIYEYTILGAVTSYADISELNWVFLDKQEMTVKNINITVNLPNNAFSKDDFYIYGHGIMDGSFNLVTNNKLEINVPKSLKGEFVEMRILMPNGLFTSIDPSHVTTNNELDALLLAEEDAKDYASLLRTVQTITYVVFGLFLVAQVFIVVYVYKKYDKEYEASFDGEYYRELPADYEPAIMGYLYKFKEIEDNDLAATLLDLIRRKYLNLEINGISTTDEDANFIISVNSNKDRNELKSYESHLINWFIDDIGDGTKVTMEELKKYTKGNEANALSYNKQNKKWCKLLENDASKYNFFDENLSKNKEKALSFSLLGLVLAGIFFTLYSRFMIDSTFILVIECFLVVGMYVTYVYSINRRSKEGNEDYVKWRAFEKFLLEFSNMKDYPVPALIVWEHYLVYATSFGIADKVMKQLKLKFTNEQLNDANLTYGRYFASDYFYYWHVNRTLSSVRMNANSTIAAATASRVDKSAGGRVGGGGFSGGSSFGGGGGSFGGR